jgi:hypothetical protein
MGGDGFETANQASPRRPTLEVGVLDDKTSEVITQKYLNEPGTAFVLHNVLSKKVLASHSILPNRTKSESRVDKLVAVGVQSDNNEVRATWVRVSWASDWWRQLSN